MGQENLTTAIEEAYALWKGWGNPSEYKRGDKEIWEALHRIIGLKPGNRLLEIGFGQGSHLHYCQSKGIVCTGIEQNEKGYKIAREAGLNVFQGDLDIVPLAERAFDAIIALDVIEHIPLEKLIPLMTQLRNSLNKNGKILLAFPNGASPFGRLHQHGDLTHINAFNRNSIEQLCLATGLRLIIFEDFPEYFEKNTISQKLKGPLRTLIRTIVKWVVKAYFNEPLGLSVVAVLEPA